MDNWDVETWPNVHGASCTRTVFVQVVQISPVHILFNLEDRSLLGFFIGVSVVHHSQVSGIVDVNGRS